MPDRQSMFIFDVLIKKSRVAECPNIKAHIYVCLRVALGHFYSYSFILHISQ